MNANQRRALAVGIPAVILIVVAWIAYSLWSNRTITYDVYIDIPDNVSAQVTGDDEYTIDEEELFRTEFEGPTTLELEEGSYMLYVDEHEDYAATIQPFTVTENTTVTISPNLNEAALQSLLREEADAIRAAVTRDVPEVNEYYQREQGKLYLSGDWYAAKLRYTGSRIWHSDSLRIVLHKENDEWRVVTDPPEIVVSQVVYPEIPREVASDINSR